MISIFTDLLEMKNDQSDGIRLITGNAIHHIGHTLQQGKNTCPSFSRHRMYHKIDILTTKVGPSFNTDRTRILFKKVGYRSSKISVMIVT
mmetsp:Transcript_8931/g.16259  ORF Transcript_8931/g.16259 Transcript_8931/m.16259 type:complete len:90 (-) Transcript_8931:46-315(-)